ncbi:MAG: aspartate-semialdehyde dehydrogenase, partial [Nitrospiria bacterium]
MLKKKPAYQVAVVGATGVVGNEMMEILEERDFPVETLHPFASPKSAGKVVQFKGKA